MYTVPPKKQTSGYAPGGESEIDDRTARYLEAGGTV